MDTISSIEKLKQSSLNENIHYAYPSELDIYSQVVLKRSSSLEVFKVGQFNSSNKFNISFSLSGELNGNFVCQFNKEDISLENQSIFTESMNIVIGKMLTNLERKTGLMSMISNPSKLADNHSFFESLSNHPHHINLCTDYKLITLKKNIDVTIFLFAQRTKKVEV